MQIELIESRNKMYKIALSDLDLKKFYSIEINFFSELDTLKF